MAAASNLPPQSNQAPSQEFAAQLESLERSVERSTMQCDASHDFSHIARVRRLAIFILYQEQGLIGQTYERMLVDLSALLHDVCDHKYATSSVASQGERFIFDLTQSNDLPVDLARAVAVVSRNVSYSHECKYPEEVRQALDLHPELAIVQDADRLDALGAIGVGRCFTYGASKAANGAQNEESYCMDDAIEHFGDKLEKLEGMMKTETGRRLARARAAKLTSFKQWWRDEKEGDFEGEIVEFGDGM